MTATEDRLPQPAREQLDLGHAPEFDRTFAESGVSSVDAVSFLKFVAQEFNLSIAAGDCVGVDSLRDLAGLVDTHSSLPPPVSDVVRAYSEGDPPVCDARVALFALSDLRRWQRSLRNSRWTDRRPDSALGRW